MVRSAAAALLCALAVCCTSNTGVHALSAAASASSSADDSIVSVPSANTTTTVSGDLIGWFDCPPVTFADELESMKGSSSAPVLPTAQCAQYKAPLCYTGICEDAKKRTIDVFFKRIQAKSDAASKPSVWFLQGGPGAGSTNMEQAMMSLYKELKGNVNVYTMDHRGTGRSTLLDCVAAQATTSGSPNAGDLSPMEVAECAKELEIKYGKDLSAFSITSAATDIASFIAKYQSGSKVYVYGVSYGTALVERLMHLNTPEIVGYVLDGVATTSGAAVSDGMYMSNWDVNFGEVADRFLDLCMKDTTCGGKFPTKSIQDTLTMLTNTSAERPYCAKFGSVNDPLRTTLGRALVYERTRGLIPALVYRMARCKNDDINAVSNFVWATQDVAAKPSEDQTFNSTLLHHLIVFSEMWEEPTPSYATLSSRFENASMSTGPIASRFELYCAFTKSNASACAAYTRASGYAAGPIAYKKDKYWNVAATIPPQASVLIMSGKLDPQTPHKYAERLFKALNGSKKELVAFEYAPQGALLHTPLPKTAAGDATCGMSILVSYVQGSGDLSNLDKTCVKSLETMSFAVSKTVSMLYFNASEPFDGAYDKSQWNTDEKRFKYVTAFVIVSVATALMLFTVACLCFRHKKRKAAAKSTTTAQQMSRDGERDDAVAVQSPSTSDGQYFAPTESRV